MAHEGGKSGQAGVLRSRMTAAERKLWSRLRSGRFHGLRWMRQEPFGPYIVDFYCSVARLVIELDGDAHAFTLEKDALRQQWLDRQGVTVIRFPNWAVLNHIDAVLDEIFVHCQGQIAMDFSSSA